MKFDEQYNPIASHLCRLDKLCYEHQKQNNINQPLQFNQTYPKNKCSVIIRKHQNHTDLAEYLHASCCGPVKSTTIKAINKGFLKHGRDFLKNMVRQHLHAQISTAKGHMARTR